MELKFNYGLNKEKRLYIAMPDFRAMINEAPAIIDYKANPSEFWLENDAVNILCYDRSENKWNVRLQFLQTWPEFNFRGACLFEKPMKVMCDEIEINVARGVLTCPMIGERGIGDYVSIKPTTKQGGDRAVCVDDIDYDFEGPLDWFDEASAIMRIVAEKYNLEECYKRHAYELPELMKKAREEELKIEKERERLKPKGLLARIF